MTNSYEALRAEISSKATLVAVSKTKSVEAILELYEQGQRDFGENYVQELVEKEAVLPKDIRWHFIGHLQRNKVKQIAPFVHLVHAIDSIDVLQTINHQAKRHNRTIDVLLQVHIAQEESKYGLNDAGLRKMAFHRQQDQGQDHLGNVRIRGLMGMASFTEEEDQVRREFQHLHGLFLELKQGAFSQDKAFTILSMGMSGDYRIALEEGSNLLRIGSLLFGNRA